MNHEYEVPTRREVKRFMQQYTHEIITKYTKVQDTIEDKIEEQPTKEVLSRPVAPIPKKVQKLIEGRGRVSEVIEKVSLKEAFFNLDDETLDKIMLDLPSYEKTDNSYPLRYV